MRARFALALLLVLLAACPAQRRSFSREALLRELEDLPLGRAERVLSLDEVAKERVPEPPAPPAELRERTARLASLAPLERARIAVALRGDVEAAERAWHELGAEPDALLHRCLVEHALERAALASASCAGFLDVAPHDPRALGALATLLLGRERDSGVDDLVLARAARWIEGCARRPPPSGCADLAHVARRAERTAAARVKDEVRARRATRASGALSSARLEGPFVGDALYAFEGAGAGRNLARRTRYVTAGSEPWDGVFHPAARHEPGLYRMVVEGRGGGDVLLVARSRYAMRVYVDGVLVLERRPEVRDEPGASRARLSLNAGGHRVEALLASHGGGDGVELALIGRDGTRALVEQSVGASLAGARVLVTPPLFPEPPTDPLARIDELLLRAHVGEGGYGVASGRHVDDARALVRELGFAPQALVAAATALEDAPRLSERLSRSDAAPLWERLSSSWPHHPRAVASRASLVRDDRPAEALSLYRALARERPDHPAGHVAVAELAAQLGLLDEALAAARALLALEPAPLELGAALSVLSKVGKRDEASALERRLAARDDELYGSGRARALLDAGEIDEARRELERLIAAEPAHFGNELLWDLLELDDPAAALARIERHLEAFPFDRSAWRRRVSLSALVDGRARALELARQAIAALGFDEQLYSAYVELGGEPPWSARLAEGDEAVRAVLAAGAARFPGHPVVLVLDHEERHLAADLSSMTVRHWIVRLGSKDALDDFGELRLKSGERAVRLRVVKPDGSERLPERREGVDDASLTGLSVGDLVELCTVAFEDAPQLPGFAHDVIPFAKPAPALVRRLELTFPTQLFDAGVRLLAKNGAPAPEIARDDEHGATRVVFRAADVGGVLPEPHAAEDVESVPVVGWTFGFHDEHWRLLRGSDVNRDAELDPLLERIARRVAGEGTPAERWQRLFAFVVTRVEPSGESADALEVLATGRGRRTPLLLALARAARIDSRPVALHLTAGPPLDVPDGDAWSLVGVRAELGERGSIALVDDGLALLDELPPVAVGARLLDLDLAPREALSLDEGVYSDRPVRVQLDLDWQGGGFGGFLAVTVPSAQAEPLRRLLRASRKSDLLAGFEQALQSTLPGARVSDVALPNLEAYGRPLGIGVALDVPVAMSGLDPVRFEHLFADGASSSLSLITPLSSYLQVAERQRPLLTFAAREVLEVEVSLPPGAAFTEVPERLDLVAGPVRLTQRGEVTDGVLVWTRDIAVDTARVSPSEWRELRPRLSELVRRTDARVAFVLPAAPP